MWTLERTSKITLQTVFLAVLMVGIVTGSVFARETTAPKPQIRVDLPRQSRLDYGPEAMRTNRSAAPGTTWLAFYSFDTGPHCVTEGWTSVDLTEQVGDFFHVDDFAGLGGGNSGLLVPLEGAQSMWCGARPDASDLLLCGYSVLPGYGNNWNQGLCTANCLAVTGGVTIDFSAAWDGEPNYDATTLEFDRCDDNWFGVYGGIGVWDGMGVDTFSIGVSDTLHSGSIRFSFHFESDGAWSDQDGIWDTDGAFILDELSVSDATGIVVPFEDFEDEAVGDNAADDWVVCLYPGYGDFAALYRGLSVVQEDPCVSRLDCLWTFYTGSTVDYSCGGWPGQTVVPYENARNQYIKNEIWSPDIAVMGAGSVWELRFDVYRDLRLGPLLFYVWHAREVIDGCPTDWDDFNFVYYGSGKDWFRATFGFGQFMTGGATHINVAVGVIDLCMYWGGMGMDCYCHSHAPLFDNFEVYRVASNGPQWQVRDIDLFQDNFSSDGTLTGTARADAANDILPSSSTGILPGDSVTVTVNDPEYGIGLQNGGAAVFCYVSVDGPHSGVVGGALVDDNRYYHVGDISAGGRTWSQIQMDTCFTRDGNVVSDKYNIDLNDNLFVPGDTVWFFFGAENNGSAATYFSFPVPTPSGQTHDIELAARNPDEFTILPATAYVEGGDVLYVDGMNFRGAQWAFDTAFEAFDGGLTVDRYDVRGPSSAVANHPVSRVADVFQQLLPVYEVIIWNTGNLMTAFGDGSGFPDKSDDTGMLLTFLDNLTSPGGVYLNGDDVADAWRNDLYSNSSTALRTAFMNFGVANKNHTSVVGINPLGIGRPGGIFSSQWGPDTLVVYGGCPLINDFDVLSPQGTSEVEMWYDGAAASAPAILSQTTRNSQDVDVGFVLSGFSFHYIRDHTPIGYPARAEHLYRIVSWLGNLVDTPTGPEDRVSYSFSLSQNHPNPFNPTTTIEYSIARTGHVSLRVYNVAGQLVRTLVDEIQTPDVVSPVTWGGRDGTGREVSSGVYFYKLSAKGFTETKKMILLK